MGVGDDAVEVWARGLRTLVALHGRLEVALEKALHEIPGS